MAAQETLFAAFHRPWHDPRPLPPNWRESAAADEARVALVPLLRDMFADADADADAAVAAVKDPRSSRVVPLWLDVAAQAGARPSALLMVRHPNEVAGSLHKRDGLSRSRAHLLWMTYLLEAERASRELPRAFVSYEALLADWRIEMDRMRKRLGVALLATTAVAEEIDGFLDVSLRNNQAERGGKPVSPFEPLALELYGLALHCAADPAGNRADEGFDAITAKLARVAAGYLDAPLRLEDELQRQALDQSRVDMSLQIAALRELWRPALPARMPGACRLYYRETSTPFNESRSLFADPVLMEDGQHVVFELPEGAKVEHLRIDPDDAPGAFAIWSLSIGGKVVEDLADRVNAMNEFALPVTSHRGGIRFAALGEDPHFELDVRGLEWSHTDGPSQVEVRFRAETVLSEIAGYLKDSGQEIEHAQRDLGERQRRLTECVELLEQRLSKFGESAIGISNDVSLMEAATRSFHVALGEEIQNRRTEHDRLQASLAHAREELQATHAQNEAVIAELESMREQQGVLLSWAQRRSLGYWWRRLRGRH
ncbi:hypothetical protein [Novilysobacter antarcticus]|uniref:hypothetical protein n=1 Tax=Novilysobacter antarcticus TaxID=2862543 RepID=UPI001C9951FC|nr:hypothetical protein [Lysobacter antarcticus]